MATLTLSVPDELKEEMDTFDIVNWSAVARAAIKEHLEQMKVLERIASKSKLTEKDALELGKMIKASMHERYLRGEG